MLLFKGGGLQFLFWIVRCAPRFVATHKKNRKKQRACFASFCFSSFRCLWTVLTDYFPWFSSETVNFLRPLARRLASTRRPFFVVILSRKPCLLTRRRLWGWNVLFIALYLFYLLLFLCEFSESGCKSTDIFRNNKELYDFYTHFLCFFLVLPHLWTIFGAFLTDFVLIS